MKLCAKHVPTRVLMSSECSKVNESTFDPQTRAKQVMKSSTREMLRAYLTTASLAVAAIEPPVLIALFLFGISAEAFQSTAFRLGACALVVAAVLGTRRLACLAFGSALKNRYAKVFGADGDSISVSPHLPGRQLVMLHLRFSRRLFELAPFQNMLSGCVSLRSLRS